jgi:hypothetical protein
VQFISETRLPKRKKFFIEAARAAADMLGEDCRMMTHRKSGLLARERLIAWNDSRKLEFARGRFKSLQINRIL